jgi:hypothetical protein
MFLTIGRVVIELDIYIVLRLSFYRYFHHFLIHRELTGASHRTATRGHSDDREPGPSNSSQDSETRSNQDSSALPQIAAAGAGDKSTYNFVL